MPSVWKKWLLHVVTELNCDEYELVYLPQKAIQHFTTTLSVAIHEKTLLLIINFVYKETLQHKLHSLKVYLNLSTVLEIRVKYLVM